MNLETHTFNSSKFKKTTKCLKIENQIPNYENQNQSILQAQIRKLNKTNTKIKELTRNYNNTK